jgi:hypothetical protein
MISTDIVVTQNISVVVHRTGCFPSLYSVKQFWPWALDHLIVQVVANRLLHPMGASYSRRKSLIEFSFLYLTFLDLSLAPVARANS